MYKAGFACVTALLWRKVVLLLLPSDSPPLLKSLFIALTGFSSDDAGGNVMAPLLELLVVEDFSVAVSLTRSSGGATPSLRPGAMLGGQ